jgi:hypothetical protein
VVEGAKVDEIGWIWRGFSELEKAANILTLLRGNRSDLGREFSKSSCRYSHFYSHFGFLENCKHSESIDFIG